ncbi:MAG: hypothetical protein DHS20C11_38400 [Lysobacteraceae bacterium]|nr:MAG: hypothetical protein DHS20C11_38400 [Xanthomonadaceae bacterium]
MRLASIDGVSLCHDLMIEKSQIEMTLDSGPGIMEIGAWQKKQQQLQERQQKIERVLQRLAIG